SVAVESLFNYFLIRVVPYVNSRPSSDPFLGRCSNCPPLIVGQDISERDLKRAMAAYYANIETIDRQYGEILDCLVDAGENPDDWVIIYTTDHGEMLGEHSIWEKQRFYEGSVRIPMMIRYPVKFQPGRCDRNVNLIDIYATLCDLCGLTAPCEVESRSLTGLMAGQTQGWDNETASQYHGKNLMIKRDDLKYHWYLEDQSEILFDLCRDPLENQNFASDPAYAADMAYFRAQRKNYKF
ncbi:MAG: sulfatase-like hydrolase/transferase, partial [Lachnospiraceae bacterium]|nr:sulfatase-like hydrolase/transferase [Lachnospiraceae bacterium]